MQQVKRVGEAGRVRQAMLGEAERVRQGMLGEAERVWQGMLVEAGRPPQLLSSSAVIALAPPPLLRPRLGRGRLEILWLL